MKVKCANCGENTEDILMECNTAVVNPEIYSLEFVKIEIKEEVYDGNEKSSGTKLTVERPSKQNSVVCSLSQCVNNQRFHTDYQQTTLKTEIKGEPIWTENIAVETNDDLYAHLQNETEDCALLITAITENGEVPRVGAEQQCNNDNLTLEVEQSSRLEDICDSEMLINQSKNNEPYRCETCKVTYKVLSLERHKLIHEDITSYKCKICAKSFKCSSSLRKHKFTHEDNKPFKCKFCHMSFIWQSHLKKHSIIHENNRPYECEVCKKTFKRASHLKCHILIHDSRHYNCDSCARSFRTASDLNSHSSVHNADSRYKCDICEKTFGWLSTLKSHILNHGGIRPYKCKICEKSFTWASSLKSHTLSHSDTKPFKCETCEKSFKSTSSLKCHNLIHDNIKIMHQ